MWHGLPTVPPGLTEGLLNWTQETFGRLRGRVGDPATASAVATGETAPFWQADGTGYVAYYRLGGPRQPTDHVPAYEDFPRRSCFRAISRDGVSWMKDPAMLLTADERDHRAVRGRDLAADGAGERAAHRGEAEADEVRVGLAGLEVMAGPRHGVADVDEEERVVRQHIAHVLNEVLRLEHRAVVEIIEVHVARHLVAELDERILAAFEAHLARDLPFLQELRQRRVTEAKALLADPQRGQAEKFRRVLDAWRSEVEYGYTIGAEVPASTFAQGTRGTDP